MGTINYGTSNYITVGYNCNYTDYLNDCYYETQSLLMGYNFYYWHVELKSGYYDGFYIDIENNFTWCFDNYREKREALKEITLIKKFLLACINDFGLCAVHPGWCTSYLDYTETLKALNEAIQAMREEVKSTCTWYTLPDNEKIPLF